MNQIMCTSMSICGDGLDDFRREVTDDACGKSGDCDRQLTGIGKDIALAFAAEGADIVVAAARRASLTRDCPEPFMKPHKRWRHSADAP